MLYEMYDDYVRAVKQSMVDYDLLSPDLRHHHGLTLDALDELRFVAHPPCSAQSCDIDHEDVVYAGQRIAERLHTTEPCLAKLWQLWWGTERTYEDLLLNDVTSPDFRGLLPLAPAEFGSKVDQQCERAVSMLRSQWHKDAAETIAGFVIELEEPQKRAEEEAAKRRQEYGVQRPNPADTDFHRFFKSLTRLGSTYQAPALPDSAAGRRRPGGLEAGHYEFGPGRTARRPGDEDEVTRLLHSVFAAASVLMSRRLRDVVYGSVERYGTFLELYADPDADRSTEERDRTPAFAIAVRVHQEDPPPPTTPGQSPRKPTPRAVEPQETKEAEGKGDDGEGKGDDGGEAEEGGEAAPAVASESEAEGEGNASVDIPMPTVPTTSLVFSPTWDDIESRVVASINTFVRSCTSFARVEQAIAVSGGGKGTDSGLAPTSVLGSVREGDERIAAARLRAAEIVRANAEGPRKLLQRFHKFLFLYR